jgi:hypothetical protein
MLRSGLIIRNQRRNWVTGQPAVPAHESRYIDTNLVIMKWV